MLNAKMYCLCLHNRTLPIVKKLGYVPVGVGNDKFPESYIIPNKFDNIYFKEKYYSLSRKAKKIGYTPIYSSIETIHNESRFLIKD